MKTLQQFTRFLDKQTDYIDELVETTEFDETIAETYGGIVAEAGRHATYFGCPAVIMRRKIGSLLAREALGTLRLWVQQNRRAGTVAGAACVFLCATGYASAEV